MPLFSIVPPAEASLILAAAAMATCPSADWVLQRITLRTKATMIPTFLYGTEKRGLYYDLMHMTKGARNMQKRAIIIARLSLFVSSLTSSSFFPLFLPAARRLTLPEEPPSAPPQTVIASGRTNQSIMIQWQPPPETHQNGPLQGYIIR